MDIYEFLNFKPRKEAFQLVKHITDLPEDKVKDRKYIRQIKYDGTFGGAVGSRMFGRSGKELMNLEYLNSYLPQEDYIVIGEVMNDCVTREVLGGLISPNRTERLTQNQIGIVSSSYFMVHDLIQIEMFIDGLCESRYSDRYSQLAYIARKTCWPGSLIRMVKNEGYSRGRGILQHLSGFDASIKNAKIEGYVFKDSEAYWKAGAKDARSVKRVEGISYDLKCTDHEIGSKGKRKGILTNLFFRWRNGKTLKADLGKGWDDSKRLELTNNPPIGKIFEVYALKESSKGKLRQPKVGPEREDKNPDF